MARQRRRLASIWFATAYQREEAQGHRIALSRSATAKTRGDGKAKAKFCFALQQRSAKRRIAATAKERKADTSNCNVLFCGGIAQIRRADRCNGLAEQRKAMAGLRTDSRKQIEAADGGGIDTHQLNCYGNEKQNTQPH